MRSYPALIATVLLLSGCSGFDRFFDDTVRLPGSNPQAPIGSSETMQKVRGNVAYISEPILPQAGNIWPSRPPAVPTLSDMAQDENAFSLSDYSKSSGADVDSITSEQNSGQSAIPSDFPEDGNMDVGEKAQIKNGVVPDFTTGRLPDHIDDHGAKYIEKGNNKPVIIPNGDGTSTVINTSGIVKVIKDSELPKDHQSKDGHDKKQ